MKTHPLILVAAALLIACAGSPDDDLTEIGNEGKSDAPTRFDFHVKAGHPEVEAFAFRCSQWVWRDLRVLVDIWDSTRYEPLAKRVGIEGGPVDVHVLDLVVETQEGLKQTA